jgi:hypothetical protein
MKVSGRFQGEAGEDQRIVSQLPLRFPALGHSSMLHCESASVKEMFSGQKTVPTAEAGEILHGSSGLGRAIS